MNCKQKENSVLNEKKKNKAYNKYSYNQNTTMSNTQKGTN